MKCWKSEPKSTAKICFPEHCDGTEPGRDPDREVKTDGNGFDSVIRDFETLTESKRFPDCIQRLREISSKLKTNRGIIPPGLVWMTEECELTMVSYGSAKEKVFLGNGFHRTVSIGLLAKSERVEGIQVYIGTTKRLNK